MIRVREERLVNVDRLVELYANAERGVFVHLNRETGRVFVTTIEEFYEADPEDLERVSLEFDLPPLFAD